MRFFLFMVMMLNTNINTTETYGRAFDVNTSVKSITTYYRGISLSRSEKAVGICNKSERRYEFRFRFFALMDIELFLTGLMRSRDDKCGSYLRH